MQMKTDTHRNVMYRYSNCKVGKRASLLLKHYNIEYDECIILGVTPSNIRINSPEIFLWGERIGGYIKLVDYLAVVDPLLTTEKKYLLTG